MNLLNRKIKHARKKNKLSQEQVGEACDPPISKSSVSQWERFEDRTPGLDNLKKFAELTGYQLNYFLDDDIPVDSNMIHEEPGNYAVTPSNVKTITYIIENKLAEPYQNMPLIKQVALIGHLFELLNDDALRDSIRTLKKTTLYKMLNVT